MRPEDMTIADFDEGQKQLLAAANMEKRTRGLPNWEIEDFVKCHPVKFPGVEIEGHETGDAPAKPDAAPAKPVRLDQRE